MILCLPHSVKRNSKLFRALLHFLILAAAAAPTFAQVYKWVDERGVTHYGERPPQGAKATEVQNKLASPAPGSAAPGSAAPASAAPESSPPKDKAAEGQAASKNPAQKNAPPKPPPSREQVEAERKLQQCEQQRAILARLKDSPPSYTLNEKGEKVPSPEHTETIARQEKRVIAQCRN
jgi:hypothetical protein